MSMFRTLLFPLALLTLLSGCARYEPLSLHGAGSMRVEVEVYTGPLSVSPEGQVGQLASVLADTVYSLDFWRHEALGYYRLNRCYESGLPEDDRLTVDQQTANQKARKSSMPGPRNEYESRDCQALGNAIHMSRRLIGQACNVVFNPAYAYLLGDVTRMPVRTCTKYSGAMVDRNEDFLQRCFNNITSFDGVAMPALCATLYNDGKPPRRLAENEHDTDAPLREVLIPELRERYENIIVAVDNLAAQLLSAGTRPIDGYLGYVPRSQVMRTELAAFSVINHDLGGQLDTRINVLSKQLKDGRDPKLLPTSDYLRGARRTDTIHIFDWLDATRGDGRLFGTTGDLIPEGRIRMAERLTQDQYWKKVDESYASGQGDVAMAFIKDERGNWDLKSFSNDPSELLRSYRKVTDALLKTAASLAGGATGNIGTATKKLSLSARATALANQVAGGGSPAAEPAEVANLHARIVDRMKARQARMITLSAELQNQITTSDAEVATLDIQITGATGTLALVAGQLTADPTNAGLIERHNTAQRTVLELQKRKTDAAVASKAAASRLDGLAKEAIEDLREIVGEHRGEIVRRESAIADTASPPAPRDGEGGNQ